MTLLCVPIFVTDVEKARRDIAAATAAGADAIELRIDTLAEDVPVESLLSGCALPVIVTCRPTWEGGFSQLGDAQRAARVAEAGATYFDFELKSATQARELRDAQARLILSFHDFQCIPDDICSVENQMDRTAAAVNKIVWTARSIRENLDAFRLLRKPKRPTVALCMGEAGLVSRVLAKKFGAFLTFASLDPSEATAPGQVSIGDMKKLYRWDAIGRETKVYGVVAHPVRHSMSPAIHNAAFTEIGFDGIYLPMLVEADYESFQRFIEEFSEFAGMNLSGLSVTIPHKENALRYLRETGGEIEPLAETIGAVNTLTLGSGGRWRGKNTDYAAIVDTITAALGADREALKGMRISVLGAGGTARAAVAALTHYGAEITVANRTMERAKLLAGEFRGNCRAVSVDQIGERECDALINTTSVGMFPKVEETPLGDLRRLITPRTLVFDTIYNPVETRLLREAKLLGAKTVGGVEMFVRQAAAQFETWTGKRAPMEVMRGVILARIGK